VRGSILRGTRALANVKAKSCDDKYPTGRSCLACAVATKQQQEVNGKYHKKAEELDLKQAQHQATWAHSRKNPASTDKRAE